MSITEKGVRLDPIGNSKIKITVIIGPTASGKSDYAVNLARKILKQENRESVIISADSRQVYKHLDVGSGKINEDEMHGVKHYALGIAEPKYINSDEYQKFTAQNWATYAANIIDKEHKNSKNIIICGGTGLYIDALLYGLTDNPAPSCLIKEKFSKLTLGEIQNNIIKLNPDYFNSLNNSEKNNKERLIRKLEILIQNDNKINENHNKEMLYEADFIMLNPDLDMLKEKIKTRLESRLTNTNPKLNLIQEIKDLINIKQVDTNWLMSLGLEYKYVTQHVMGDVSYEEMLSRTLLKIFQYAKRQIKWNKRYTQLTDNHRK